MNDAARLLELLKEKGLSLGSVESMTAGLFGATFCEVPGASAAYKGGLITYASEEKIALADVDPRTIERHGVVSPNVAVAMARGGAKMLGVDVCVSITGNAGPTAEEGEAPVGQTYIGAFYKGNKWVISPSFAGERNQIRAQAVKVMVNFLCQILENSKN